MTLGTDLELIDEGELEGELVPVDEQEEIAARISDIQIEISQLVSEAVALGQEEVTGQAAGSALVPSTGTAAAAKKQIAGIRARAVKQAQLIEGKRGEIQARQREMKELMDRQVALAMQAIAPLQKMVKRLEEGIWMVNLYLGRDEEILLLRDGEPADASVPITIRQMVLAMDEECAINPDEDGIDADNIEEFDGWLKASWDHVIQCAPEERCVVALRPRWKSKHHEDIHKRVQMQEADAKTYFLIRNGERVFRTWTDFEAGDRLVPLQDEFSSFFYEKPSGMMPSGVRIGFDKHVKGKDHRIPIEPGTPAWERAEEAADASQRHYMRVGLILQGLVDRTTVFHPLPEGGVSFMDYEQGGDRWRFLSNDELTLTTDRQPFYDWLAERNAALKPGMRIVGSFSKWYSRDNDPYRYRIHPRGAERPPSGELLVIDREEADGIVVLYPRTQEIYDPKMWREDPDHPGWGWRGGSRVPRQRASCVLDRDALTFLPFDLVTEEEMLVYLGARLERHAYAEMFPLLKQAIRAKREERKVEDPFRVMLSGVLARDNGVPVEDAVEALDSLIGWWKLTNKNHRPLVGDEESQAKAVRLIVAEHARRLKAAKKGVSGSIVESLVRFNQDAIAVGRRRDGRYVVVASEAHELIDVTPFVQMRNCSARGVLKDVERWKLLTKAQVEAIEWAWKSEAFDALELGARPNDHLTGPEFDRMAEQALGDRGAGAMAVAYDPKDHEFHTWRLADGAVVTPGRPITGKLRDVVVKHVERRWRKGKVKTLASEYHSTRGEHVKQAKPWDTRRPASWSDDKPVTVNRYVVLFEDPAVEARMASEHERYEEAHAEHRAAIAKYQELVASIEAAWVARRERELFDRFLEDYLDPELWEGHKKTLDRDALAYPHTHWGSGSYFDRDRRDALGWLVTYAVECGIDLDGLTVWEAAERHFPPVEYMRPREDDDGFPERKKPRVWEPIDIQEDLRELRFVAPAKSTDTTEEEDEDGTWE